MDVHEDATSGRHAEALAHLRRSDPVLARLIDARPEFDPRARLSELPEMDSFGTLVFQVIGQQLSLGATRSILRRLVDRFDGRMPTPAQLLATDPDDIRRARLSRRKIEALRELAERFLDGRLSTQELQTLSDEEVKARLTAVRGVGPWTAPRFFRFRRPTGGRRPVCWPGSSWSPGEGL
jgi:DNA-3-methyladenine glycosylase II